MKTKLTFTLAIAAVTALASIPPDHLSAGEAADSLTGHGTFFNFGFTALISMNAWTDDAGNADGMITWEEAFFEYDTPSALPGGLGWSGIPWSIAVAGRFCRTGRALLIPNRRAGVPLRTSRTSQILP